MRFKAHSRFYRDLLKTPAEISAWALSWAAAAEIPGATLSEITQGASPLKGRDVHNCFVRKWRKKKPHGEYRLVFRATKEEVVFVALEPRGSDYKIAQRRIRALPR